MAIDGALRISSAGVAAEVLPYGAHLVRLETPDRSGGVASVVVALDTADAYRDRSTNPYVGSIVGRWANRIRGARFPLEYLPVEVVPNDGPHQLHGGPDGWDRRIWSVVSHTSDRIELGLVSPDGDQGFPGAVHVVASYSLTATPNGVVFELEMVATSDRSTPVNATTHTYWNLSGDPSASVDDHRLTVPGEWIVEVDDELLPTGRLPDVAGTPFDLRNGPLLGDVLDAVDAEGSTLDRCYVLTHAVGRETPELRTAASLEHPGSGRVITVATNQPGVQVYVPTGPVGGHPTRGGVCLETQQLPDALNRPGFKPKVLRVNGTYRHVHRVTLGTV
ncbi:MAG: aldose epimerase family protein [Actinomycetes bacterium]